MNYKFINENKDQFIINDDKLYAETRNGFTIPLKLTLCGIKSIILTF